MTRKRFQVEQETTDEFLDKPLPLYGPDRKTLAQRFAARAEAAARRAASRRRYRPS